MGFVRMPELDFWPIPGIHVMAYRLSLSEKSNAREQPRLA
jgi:hypothetical protein